MPPARGRGLRTQQADAEREDQQRTDGTMLQGAHKTDGVSTPSNDLDMPKHTKRKNDKLYSPDTLLHDNYKASASKVRTKTTPFVNKSGFSKQPAQ